jgi:hypothetical protein
VFVHLSCDTTETVNNSNDPRFYKWTTDTLKDGYITELNRFWGSSNKNIYLCGYSRDETKPPLYHFDGTKWTRIDLPINTHFVEDVFGFSSNDVWAVGSTTELNGVILHFDGYNWKYFTLTESLGLNAIWGSSPNNIWAGGINELWKYNGIEWTKFPISLPPRLGGSYGILPIIQSIGGLNSYNVYLVAGYSSTETPMEEEYYYLYNFNGESWNLIDSTKFEGGIGKFGIKLKNIRSNLYSTCYGLFDLSFNDWYRRFTEPYIISMGGSNSNNLIAANGLKSVYHFNGIDWEQLSLWDGLDYSVTDIWAEGKEAFLVSSDGRATYILHGK